jgi:hypothetical protein
MVAASLLGAGCGPKAGEGDATATPADSTPAGQVRVDAAGTDPTRRADSLPTVTSSSKALHKADSIIGRDSAFGPKFTLDAQGKLTPIKKP